MKSGEKIDGTVQSLNNDQLTFFYTRAINEIGRGGYLFHQFCRIRTAKAESGTESSSALPKEVGEKQITAGSYLVRYKVADRKSQAPKLITSHRIKELWWWKSVLTNTAM